MESRVKGVQLKNVKNTHGIEGIGCTATVYLKGKKIGEYADWGDGACGTIDYVSKDAEKEFMQVIIDFAKDHPNKFIENLYKERPEQYQQEAVIFKKYHPYIKDEDITERTMASNSVDYIITELLELIEIEKVFKKHMKTGYYKAIGIKGDDIFIFNNAATEKSILAKKCDKYFYSLVDFVED